jgi:hypothetical protein
VDLKLKINKRGVWNKAVLGGFVSKKLISGGDAYFGFKSNLPLGLVNLSVR